MRSVTEMTMSTRYRWPCCHCLLQFLADHRLQTVHSIYSNVLLRLVLFCAAWLA